MGKDMILQPEQLGPLFDMSSDPVMGIDSSQTVVYANPPAAQVGARTGMHASELLPEHILSEPAAQFIAAFQLGSRRLNVSLRRMEGLTLCVCSLPDSPAPALGYVRALQEMSSSLMTARLAMDALTVRLNADADPALQDAANALYKQYYMLCRTCTHMRQAAGILQGDLPFQPRATDLGTVCRELCDTVDTLIAPMGISVVFKADFAMNLTMADRELLESMLSNLLANSLLHCKRGDAIRVELGRQNERFIIAVNDPGTGIPPEKLSAIFNGIRSGDLPDATAGAGLGLFVARGIAERHGGTMILESRPGQGTSVRISIPYRKSESTVINSPVTRYRSDGMNTVLIEFSSLLDKKYFARRMFD